MVCAELWVVLCSPLPACLADSYLLHSPTPRLCGSPALARPCQMAASFAVGQPVVQGSPTSWKAMGSPSGLLQAQSAAAAGPGAAALQAVMQGGSSNASVDTGTWTVKMSRCVPTSS